MEKCDYVMVKERIIVPDAVAVKRADRRAGGCRGERDGKCAGYCSKT